MVVRSAVIPTSGQPPERPYHITCMGTGWGWGLPMGPPFFAFSVSPLSACRKVDSQGHSGALSVGEGWAGRTPSVHGKYGGPAGKQKRPSPQYCSTRHPKCSSGLVPYFRWRLSAVPVSHVPHILTSCFFYTELLSPTLPGAVLSQRKCRPAGQLGHP